MASPKALLPLLLVAALSLSPFCFHVEAAEEFDFFTLALYWPSTVCKTSMNPHCCFENECCRLNSLPDFTIHGFWPDYTNGSWPKCCSNTPLVESDISRLIPALVEYWPNLYCGEYTLCDGEKGNQWAYEWGQHGTCAAPYLGDSFKYFQKALSLYTTYDISSALTSAGIGASNAVAYRLSTIIRIIEKVVGATPAVICNGDSLYQLRLCFNKDFTPRDCATISTSSNSCPSYVVLPELTSGGIIDGNRAITRMLNRKTFKPLTVA